MDTGDSGGHGTIQDCLDALVKETERLKRVLAAGAASAHRDVVTSRRVEPRDRKPQR